MKPKDERDITRRKRQLAKRVLGVCKELPCPSHKGESSIDYNKNTPHHMYAESSGKGHSKYRKYNRFYSPHSGPDTAGFKKWYKRKIRHSKEDINGN